MSRQEALKLADDRLQLNLNRVGGLLGLSDTLAVGEDPIKPTTSHADLMRAIIVFMHVTFEDFLRTLHQPKS